MFRATSCSSSGVQIVLKQHLVSSISVSDRPVHKLREYMSYRFADSLRLRKLSAYMFIIRRLNCIDAASGIVTLSKWPSGAQVERVYVIQVFRQLALAQAVCLYVHHQEVELY